MPALLRDLRGWANALGPNSVHFLLAAMRRGIIAMLVACGSAA